jgi:uncharacterized membrane protein YphA (DoxX/SURF4 family)
MNAGPGSAGIGGSILLLVARLILGGMFVYLGVQKALDPVAFLKAIRLYEMVPESWPHLLNFMASVLPWAEILLGALILFGVAVRGAALSMLALLLVFSTAIALRALAVAAREGIAFCMVAFDCGCGLGVERVCRKLPENAALIAAALVVLFSRCRRLCARAELIR